MFDFVEKHKRLAQIVLALMTIPFAVWGIESYTRSRSGADTVATVNGLTISQREFDEEVNRQQEQLRRMFGRNFDPAAFDTPQARRALLESLVSQRLLASAAQSGHIAASDDALIELIHSIPAFQSEGRFSSKQYELALRSANPPMSPAQFEARVRYDLALQQLGRAVADSAIAPRSVTERLAAIETQKREVSEARVPAEQFLASVTVDDAKIKAYYDANPDEFRIPEQVRAEYALLSADALARLEPVTDEELRAAYKDRAKQFQVPEQRRASHILVKTKEQAEKVLAEVKKSPGRFADLAKKESQDTGSAEKGGDLGWFSSGMMVKPFEDAVFSMKKPGELAGPVQSEFGFHVIKLTGIQPAKSRSFDEVKKELADELARQKGAKKFAEAAETFSNLVYEQPDSLKPAADRFKLTLRTTPWIAKSAHQELGPLDNPKLLAALFSADAIKSKRNTDAIEVAPGTLVAARVAEYQPASLRSFDQVKGEIATKLKKEQAAELAQKDGAAKLERLRKGEDAGVKWGPARSVSRREAQGMQAPLLEAAVTADTSKLPAYAGVPVPGAGYVLLKITKVTDVEPAKEREPELEARAGGLYGSAQYDAYIASLRSRADISVKQENLERK
jgi:peptidyl-prolyl cis-trans isomerase D